MQIPRETDILSKEEISKLTEEEYYSKITCNLCYMIGGYASDLINELFPIEERIIKTFDLNNQDEKKQAERLQLFNKNFIVYDGNLLDKRTFHLINPSEISLEKRIELEKIMSQRTKELIEIYNKEGDPIKYHLDNSRDKLIETCLRLNPAGYFKKYLQIGIVEGYQNESESQVAGIRVRMLDRQQLQKKYQEYETIRKELEKKLAKSIPDPNKDIYAYINAMHEMATAKLDLFKNEIDKAVDYARIRSVLTNTNLDITPINTTVAFFLEEKNCRNSIIYSGKLIQILPSTPILNLGLTETLKHISEDRN